MMIAENEVTLVGEAGEYEVNLDGNFIGNVEKHTKGGYRWRDFHPTFWVAYSATSGSLGEYDTRIDAIYALVEHFEGRTVFTGPDD